MADNVLHPRENPELSGHEKAENEFLAAHASGTAHHAWLITGPRGIGKATLAYRIARFLLSGGAGEEQEEIAPPDLFGDPPDAQHAAPAASLRMDPSHPVFRHVAQGTHGDLLVLEADEGEGEMEITVDAVRGIAGFLHNSSFSSGRRAVIIDSADALNANAANALLKILEEPAGDTTLLLISHAPRRLLPTIRSRCRFLNLRPLESGNLEKVIAKSRSDMAREERAFAAALAQGSPGAALELAQAGGLELYYELADILRSWPEPDIVALHALGDKMARKENIARWRALRHMLGWMIAAAVDESISGTQIAEFTPGEREIRRRMAASGIDHLAALWENSGRIAAECDGLNMDRKMALLRMLEAA